MNKDDAKIQLPDGRIAYDCVKRAAIPTEGLFVKDLQDGSIVFVQTRHTQYIFTKRGEQIIGLAVKEDGSTPKYLPFEIPVRIHGSTWGGSMIKLGYIGVEMHLEFSTYEDGSRAVRTSEIQCVRVAGAAREAA